MVTKPNSVEVEIRSTDVIEKCLERRWSEREKVRDVSPERFVRWGNKLYEPTNRY